MRIERRRLAKLKMRVVLRERWLAKFLTPEKIINEALRIMGEQEMLLHSVNARLLI